MPLPSNSSGACPSVASSAASGSPLAYKSMEPKAASSAPAAASKPSLASNAARSPAALLWPAWNDLAWVPKWARVPAAWATPRPIAWQVPRGAGGVAGGGGPARTDRVAGPRGVEPQQPRTGRCGSQRADAGRRMPAARVVAQGHGLGELADHLEP